MADTKRRALGSVVAAMVVFDAVLLLNLAYLWDLIVDTYDGWILLGWKAYTAVAIANAAIIIGLAWLFARAARPRGGDGQATR
jgi:hypothetical protein